jgi:hypothetical protein
VARSEEVLTMKNGNTGRVAVRSIAWLDDKLERALELNGNCDRIIRSALLLLHRERQCVRQRINKNHEAQAGIEACAAI